MGNDDQYRDALKAEGRTDDQNHETHKVKFEDDRDNRPLMEHFLSDACEVLTIGIPCVVAQGARFVQETTISIILGRKNTVLLAGVGVSNIWTSWMDYMIMGGANQVGTLCGMAYGAGNFPLCGTWLKVGLVFITVLCPPLIILRFYTTPVLEFLGVPSIVAEPAGLFTIYSAVALISELWYAVIAAFFMAQGIVKPDMWICIAFIVVASIVMYIVVIRFSAGIVGVALGLSLKRALRVATLVIYSWYQGLFTKTWAGWGLSDVMVASRWKVFLPMVLPAMMGGVAETIHWSISSLLAARLGPAMSASFDLIMCMQMMIGAAVGGVASGIGSLMARNLGRGLPKRSWEITKVGCVLVYGFLGICAAALYAFNPIWAGFCSSDPIVHKEILNVRFITAFSVVMCGGLLLVADIVCRQGRPDIVFTYMPLFNWFVGLPTSFFLQPIMGIQGILIGQCIGYTLAHAVILYYLFTSDWEALAAEARLKSEVEGVEAKPVA